jgi:fibrillarin-like rRNA methylase
MLSVQQEQDFDYFIQNIKAFYKQYGHKFLAIKDRNILGAYDSFNAALEETLKQEQAGTFIIQECFKNKEESISHIYGLGFATRRASSSVVCPVLRAASLRPSGFTSSA